MQLPMEKCYPLQNLGFVDILVVSPTRELATQISTQGEALLKFHPGRAQIQTIFGGTSSIRDLTDFARLKPSVVVATPGRLLDHIKNGRLSNGHSFADSLKRLKVNSSFVALNK